MRTLLLIYLVERRRCTTDSSFNSSWQPRPKTETDRCERSLIDADIGVRRIPSGIPVDAAVVGIIHSTTFPVVESKVMQEIKRYTSIESCIKQYCVNNSLNIDPRFAIFLIA
jgi:hypothetical protein